MKIKIPKSLLKAELPVLATRVQHVRLFLQINADIGLKRVTVEGQVVSKWTPVAGMLAWDNPKQIVTGSLDVTLEIWGGPNGSASLVTVCDGRTRGTINLLTSDTGSARKEESYDV